MGAFLKARGVRYELISRRMLRVDVTEFQRSSAELKAEQGLTMEQESLRMLAQDKSVVATWRSTGS